VDEPPRYRKLNTWLRETFGRKVYRVGLCGDFACPNRDGTLGVGGCIFCNPASSEPLGYGPGMPVREQLEKGTQYVRGRHGADRFIAFFSDYTTTYADVERLGAMVREAIAWPGMVGLAVSTRPDCLPPEVLDLLEAVSRETFLWVELGIQSAHDESLELLRRCHAVEDSRRAVAELRARNIVVSGHVILGLPGESADDMMATARFLADCGVQGAKIHNLHVVKETELAEMYRRGEVACLELDEYVDLAVRFLEQLPPSVVIQRVSGEAPRRLTVAPEWSINKLAVVNAVGRELVRRDTWQGKGLGYPAAAVSEPLHLYAL
jgi:radical SAM protein (TIGR01212 family)